MKAEFESYRFHKRLITMLKVDFRRMCITPLLYIMIFVCMIVPVLILVMTTMTDGSVTVDPQTGEETVIEGFQNVWQIFGSVGSELSNTAMDIKGMCNINLLYFALAIFVCLFVSADFGSGYSKNLFTVRAKKGEYVVSKTVVCIFAGVLMLASFFVGSMVGAAAAGLSFDLENVTPANLVFCFAAKALLTAVFVPVFLLASVCAQRKVWLSIPISLFGGMLLFMMVPMITPLDAGIMNAVMCFAGGVMFSGGLGVVSQLVLRKSDLT